MPAKYTPDGSAFGEELEMHHSADGGPASFVEIEQARHWDGTQWRLVYRKTRPTLLSAVLAPAFIGNGILTLTFSHAPTGTPNLGFLITVNYPQGSGEPLANYELVFQPGTIDGNTITCALPFNFMGENPIKVFAGENVRLNYNSAVGDLTFADVDESLLDIDQFVVTNQLTVEFDPSKVPTVLDWGYGCDMSRLSVLDQAQFPVRELLEPVERWYGCRNIAILQTPSMAPLNTKTFTGSGVSISGEQAIYELIAAPFSGGFLTPLPDTTIDTSSPMSIAIREVKTTSVNRVYGLKNLYGDNVVNGIEGNDVKAGGDVAIADYSGSESTALNTIMVYNPATDAGFVIGNGVRQDFVTAGNVFLQGAVAIGVNDANTSNSTTLQFWYLQEGIMDAPTIVRMTNYMNNLNVLAYRAYTNLDGDTVTLEFMEDMTGSGTLGFSFSRDGTMLTPTSVNKVGNRKYVYTFAAAFNQMNNVTFLYNPAVGNLKRTSDNEPFKQRTVYVMNYSYVGFQPSQLKPTIYFGGPVSPMADWTDTASMKRITGWTGDFFSSTPIYDTTITTGEAIDEWGDTYVTSQQLNPGKVTLREEGVRFDDDSYMIVRYNEELISGVDYDKAQGLHVFAMRDRHGGPTEERNRRFGLAEEVLSKVVDIGFVGNDIVIRNEVNVDAIAGTPNDSRYLLMVGDRKSVAIINGNDNLNLAQSGPENTTRAVVYVKPTNQTYSTILKFAFHLRGGLTHANLLRLDRYMQNLP